MSQMSIGNPGRMLSAEAMPQQPAGRIVFALMLVMAAIGATFAPFLADLLTASAGALVVYCLALAALAPPRQGPGDTPKFLKAV